MCSGTQSMCFFRSAPAMERFPTAHRLRQLVYEAPSVRRAVPKCPVNRIEVRTERILEWLPIGEAYWKDGWLSALLLRKMMGRFDLGLYHLAVD